MDSSAEDDPELNAAVKDSLRRQVAELRLRLIEQSESNTTADLQLRAAYDQAKTKLVMKALQLKRQVSDSEAALLSARLQWASELSSLSSCTSTLLHSRVHCLKTQACELCKVKQLFTPLVFRTPRRPQRALLEESTAQDPGTPFIEETPDNEQVPTTPESLPKPADRVDCLQAEVEDKVAALFRLVTTRLEQLKEQLTTLEDSSSESYSLPFRDTPDTRSMVEEVEGDEEVTIQWEETDLTPCEEHSEKSVRGEFTQLQGDQLSAEMSAEESCSPLEAPPLPRRSWRRWLCCCRVSL